MPRFLFEIAYLGTGYFGWQRQKPGQLSVQEVCEGAIQDLVGHKVHVYGASRTDRGVHASAMAAQADLNTKLEAWQLQRAIGVRLPRDIRLRSVSQVNDDFNCRFAAHGKCYSYHIYNSTFSSCFMASTSYHVRTNLCDQTIREAIACCIGEHDFSSFATALAKHEDKLTSPLDPDIPEKPRGNVRELYSFHLIRHGPSLRMFFIGKGFLRGMVRALVGTLLEIGCGRLAVSSMGKILAACDRSQAGPNVPAQGLKLEKVFFDKQKLMEWQNGLSKLEQISLSQDFLHLPQELQSFLG